MYVPSDHVPNGKRGALYLFDGQNVFDDTHSFAGGWFSHEALDSIGRRGRNIPVIVAINHGGTRRIAELTPWRARRETGPTGELLDWMIGTLIPRVQKLYGLRTGPVGSVIGGSSMGGLAALYAHFRNPETFGGALCMSPSFWVAGGEIFRYVQSKPNPAVSRIYLDCGGREGGGGMLAATRQMAYLFHRRGYGPRQLMWRPDRSAGHNERAWRKRLPKALRFMLKA